MHSNSADLFGRLSIILTPDLLINIKYPNFKIIFTLKLKINGFSERIYKFKVSLLSHNINASVRVCMVYALCVSVCFA